MSKYEVGCGKPPKTTRYRPGVSGNPKERPRRKPSDIAQIVRDTLSAPIQYREGERVKVATYLELKIKKLIQEAIKGNLAAAELLLKTREHVQRYGDVGIDCLQISNWLPDHPGQTAQQKSRDRAKCGEADPIEWWKDAPPMYTRT
jgi:hypothetical protein